MSKFTLPYYNIIVILLYFFDTPLSKWNHDFVVIEKNLNNRIEILLYYFLKNE